jgi:glycosyltransferase involved in cell wall biosynthesis
MGSEKHNVSLIIPVRNGMDFLKDSIPLFLTQEKVDNLEIILIDSESSDGLKEFIDSINDQRIKLIPVKLDDFNHGLTRNLGIQYAKFDVIVFTVQDAKPISSVWLYNLISPLVYLKLDGVCGQQIVPKNKLKNPVEWFRPISKPELRLVEMNPKEYLKLSPLEKKKITSWDNVNACYSKESLATLPFAELNFGEDAFWADLALKNGFKIGFTGLSQVEHYHHYDVLNEIVRRVIAEHLINKKVYDIDPLKFQISLSKTISIVKSIFLTELNLFEKIYWLKYNSRIYLANLRAYKIWMSFNSISEAEDFVNIKIPQSNKNVR